MDKAFLIVLVIFTGIFLYFCRWFARYNMDLKALEQKLQSAVSALKNEFQTIRSGRPSPVMVEDIKVEVYGQQTPVKALGSIFSYAAS